MSQENVFKEILNWYNEIKDEEQKMTSWIKDLVKEVPEAPVIFKQRSDSSS